MRDSLGPEWVVRNGECRRFPKGGKKGGESKAASPRVFAAITSGNRLSHVAGVQWVK